MRWGVVVGTLAAAAVVELFHLTPLHQFQSGISCQTGLRPAVLFFLPSRCIFASTLVDSGNYLCPGGAFPDLATRCAASRSVRAATLVVAASSWLFVAVFRRRRTAAREPRGARSTLLAQSASSSGRPDWACVDVQLGHDGSPEATRWLEDFAARRLMTPNVRLLSPLGERSTVPTAAASCGVLGDAGSEGLGRVFALLPDGRVARRLETSSLAMEPPWIGRQCEWDAWDYASNLLGHEWRDLYAFEYWRFLQAAAPTRASATAKAEAALRSAAECGKPGAWWRAPGSAAQAAVSMLREHGYCVLDDFLPSVVAAAVAHSAHAAWEDGRMANGVVTSDAFARGDSVLWVNTEDPATRMKTDEYGRAIAPKKDQASAAVPILGEVLSYIDALVGKVLAPELPEAQAIATRSHAMFTCYPAPRHSEGSQPIGSGSRCERGYLRHVDNQRMFDAAADNGRVLTTILYLNEGWDEHHEGALRLFERSPPLQVRGEVLPKLNRLVAFWASEVPHEVRAPCGRDRFALTFWYMDRRPGPTTVAFNCAPATAERPPAAAAAVGSGAAAGGALDFAD